MTATPGPASLLGVVSHRAPRPEIRTTTMTKRIWILGASDPEMAAIESRLLAYGEAVAYAIAGSVRVTPATAYRGTGMRHGTDVAGDAGGAADTWYLVECSVPVPSHVTAHVIDHHRPGDPGYGRPPSEFLPASSIGQVLAVLRRHCPAQYDRVWFTSDGGEPRDVAGNLLGLPYAVEVPHEYVLIAAADHCLGAAYRGECPGVDPDELMRWRAASRAAFQRRSVDAILADVARAQEALMREDDISLETTGFDKFGQVAEWSGYPAVDWTEITVRDMRDYCVVEHDCGFIEIRSFSERHPDGTPAPERVSHKHGCPGQPYGGSYCNGWTVREPIPELPEAATRLGIGYISGPLVAPDGRRKITCSGTAEQVRAFLDSWAPSQGLVDCYGDPARGFAGGYLLCP